MIDLDGVPPCRDCGAPMVVTEWPGYGPDGSSLWSAECTESDEHWEILDREERPTLRTEPGLAPLIAEIERLRAELVGLRAYIRRSIADDLGIEEVCDILDNLPAEDRAAVDAWAAAMKDPAYWSKDLAIAQAELADARLALAMARGEGWPKGWTWDERNGCFHAPRRPGYIKQHFGGPWNEGAPSGWRIWRRDKQIPALSIADDEIHPTALDALRAYMVKP